MPERSECAPWRRSCWIELSRADSADSRTRQEASSCKSVWSGAEEEARRSLSERRGRSRPPSRRTPPEDQDRNRIRPQQSTLTIPHSSRPLRRRRSSGSRPRESQKLQGVRPGAAQRRLRDPRWALYPLLLRRARQVVHSGRDHLRRRRTQQDPLRRANSDASRERRSRPSELLGMERKADAHRQGTRRGAEQAAAPLGLDRHWLHPRRVSRYEGWSRQARSRTVLFFGWRSVRSRELECCSSTRNSRR